MLKPWEVEQLVIERNEQCRLELESDGRYRVTIGNIGIGYIKKRGGHWDMWDAAGNRRGDHVAAHYAVSSLYALK